MLWRSESLAEEQTSDPRQSMSKELKLSLSGNRKYML